MYFMMLMRLCLFVLAIATQASNNTTRVNFILEDKLTDGLSRMLDINQTFPVRNSTLLSLNEDNLNNNTSSELDTQKPQNASVEERIDGHGIYDKIVKFPINATVIFHPKSFDRNVEADSVLFQNSSIREKTIANFYGQNYKVVPINFTAISELDDWHLQREELHKEILRQFDLISTDLQDLAKVFSTNQHYNKSLEDCPYQIALPRSIRSLPLDSSSTCEVEHAVLVNFKDELLVTLNGTNQADNSNCEVNSDSDTCDELIRLILCGYNHLKSGFTRATENSASLGEATMWKNKFEDYKEKSSRLLNDKIRFISQENQQKIDKFKTDLQNLQNKANRYIEIIKGDGPRVCAYEIQNGNIDKAIDKFSELIGDEIQFDNYRLIVKIIEKTYRLENIDNIVSFIDRLPWLLHRVDGYEEVFKEMSAKQHLGSPYVLKLVNMVQLLMDKKNNFEVKQNAQPRLESLKNNLSPYADNIIDVWANKIRSNNDIEQIKDFSKKHNEVFKANLPDLIVKSYANSLDNIENVIKFIRDSLPYIEQQIIGFSPLFEKMKNNNHLDSNQLILFAYQVKGAMEQTNYHSIKLDYKNQFTALKNSIPSSVRGLIWNGNSCTIRNGKRWEYLYSPSATHDSKRRYVFTWIEGNEVLEGDWQFKAYDSAKSFSIRNTHRNEYLYAAKGTYTKDVRRHVFTWIPGHEVIEGYWEIIPCDGGEYFKIRNAHWKEYLYSDGAHEYNSKRRYVFTWGLGVPQGVMEQESQWFIKC